MVLSWSRAIFARFVLDQTLESFLRSHVAAFEAFGGVPRAVLYDNLKTAVLERVGDVIRFHPRLLDLAGYYHFAPQPVGVARGNEKGRVERAIRYIRESFFAARSFESVDHLNAQLGSWIQHVAHERVVPADPDRRLVAAALEEERARLLPMPQHPFTCDYLRPTASGKTPYIRFDGNDYSIPHELVRKPVTIVASDTTVRILDGDVEVARHGRSYDRGRQIETPSHLDGLTAAKQRSREHRGRNRLAAACPAAKPFLEAVALHGGHLGGTTARLLRLLDQYGADDVDGALTAARERGAFSAQSVAHVLDQQQRARRVPPRFEPTLPDDPRVREMDVTPHPLASYDVLADRQEGRDG